MKVLCNSCPRRCNALREDLKGFGFCRQGLLPKVSKACLHFWEEPPISGERGSGAIFFSGCTLKCVFCQNEEISQKDSGRIISIGELAKLYQILEEKGAHNINLVSPTHFVDAICKSFEIYRPKIPVVYNTSGYETIETLKRLEGLVDIYLPDLKYISNDLSKRYSKAENYFENASKAIAEMVRQTGKPEFDDDSMLKKGTIVRHMILPSHTKEAILVLNWLKNNFKDDILVSLMGQYVPLANAHKYEEIYRKLTSLEYEVVQDYLLDLDLDGFVQDLSSADENYVPDFSGSIL